MSFHTASLGIMTSEQFKDRTKATRAVCGLKARFKSRGSNMAEIDHALELWEVDCGKSCLDTLFKIGLLCRIKNACQKWLDRKRGKSSRLANFRKQVVTEVLNSTKKPIHYLSNKYHTQQSHHHGRVTKGLAKGYDLERKHYLALQKQQNPWAAGDVAMESDMDQKIPLAAMTMTQYTNYGTARVDYFNRAQRLQFMALIEGGLFYDGETPLDCPPEPGFSGAVNTVALMYAVDKYGSMFTKKIKGFNGTYFNHSSFCAGKEIFCAGTVVFDRGQLKFISTNSGHYKPPPPQMLMYLALLGEEDVELDDVCVAVNTGGGMLVSKAPSFMNDMNANDWPDQDGNGVYLMINGQRCRLDEPT